MEFSLLLFKIWFLLYCFILLRSLIEFYYIKSHFAADFYFMKEKKIDNRIAPFAYHSNIEKMMMKQFQVQIKKNLSFLSFHEDIDTKDFFFLKST